MTPEALYRDQLNLLDELLKESPDFRDRSPDVFYHRAPDRLAITVHPGTGASREWMARFDAETPLSYTENAHGGHPAAVPFELDAALRSALRFIGACSDTDRAPD